MPVKPSRILVVCISSYMKPDMIGNRVNRTFRQSSKITVLNQPHTKVEKPAIIKFRHDIHRPQFMQFQVSPVIQKQAIVSISDMSDQQQCGFLQAFHFSHPFTSITRSHLKLLSGFSHLKLASQGSGQCVTVTLGWLLKKHILCRLFVFKYFIIFSAYCMSLAGVKVCLFDKFCQPDCRRL